MNLNRKVITRSVRFFSSQAKKPYAVTAAESLFAAASKQAGGDLYAPTKVLQKWQVAQASVPQFQSVFDHPLATPARKEAFLKDFAAHLGADKATTDALLSINADKKWGALPEIVRVYNKLAAEQNKDQVVTVTAAEPLTKEQLAEVTKNLASITKKGFKLSIVEKVNPAIMGGLVIDAEGVHQDLSLATALSSVEAKIEKAL